MRHRFTKVLLAVALFTLLAGTGDGRRSLAQLVACHASYNVGIVYSRTGLLGAYGAE